MRSKAIEPGATLGVFGGGQLGRMFAQAAQKMGYRVVVFTDEIDAPKRQLRRASYGIIKTDIESMHEHQDILFF